MEEPRIPEQEVYIWTIYFKINIEWINVWKKIALITFELHTPQPLYNTIVWV